MIEILKESGLKVAAEKLATYNNSPGLIKISYKLYLPVTPSRYETKRSGDYIMNKPVRGKCFIINNEPKLYRESFRFQNIFYQLNFTVDIDFKMTTQQFKNKFESLVKEPETFGGNDALIVMVISHGQEESVLGYNSSTYMPDPKDAMKISEIVDIFSDCKSLLNKPKLFFFTCCRISKKFQIILSNS